MPHWTDPIAVIRRKIDKLNFNESNFNPNLCKSVKSAADSASTNISARITPAKVKRDRDDSPSRLVHLLSKQTR